ncbi:MAG: hypothetical protein LBR20_01915 [Propionibacteriaceae bacterium]|nr:hypothetical protein [Propionibacteriaceae bacterium]
MVGPPLPEDLDLKALPRGVQAELKGLGLGLAGQVGGHLLLAGQLIDENPELAFEHAQAAKEQAPRLQITREAFGEAAYALGRYTVALTEFRAVRRMSGSNEYLAAMADCERALGRYDAALKLIKEGLATVDSAFDLVELKLVEAGIRADTGQLDEAVRILLATNKQLGPSGPKSSRARLRYAIADLLERTGKPADALKWFRSSQSLDPEETLDTADRISALE